MYGMEFGLDLVDVAAKIDRMLGRNWVRRWVRKVVRWLKREVGWMGCVVGRPCCGLGVVWWW